MCYIAGDTLLTDVCYIKSHDGDVRRVGTLLLILICAWCRCWPDLARFAACFNTPDVTSHSLSVHLSLFDGVESCPHVELTLINTSAHLVLWYNGTGSCIPLPISELTIFRIFIGMNLAWWYLVTTTSMISAAYTQAFLDAFASLGIEPWAGIEMDVAWGQTTLRFGLHRPSVTGPIFVYRVCTALRQDTPTRMQVLSHADLSPDQLLSAIAGQHPDLRDTWADGGWQLCAIDATRGHSRDSKQKSQY